MKGIKRIAIIGVLVIVLTLLEAMIIKGLVGNQDSVQVYIATRNIEYGETISLSNASPTNIPVALVTENHIKSIDKSLYAGRTIYKSEQLSSINTSLEAPQQIKSGHVYVGLVPEASNAVAWQLKRGDKVNIDCIDEDNKQISFTDVPVVEVIDEGFKRSFTEESVANPKFLIVDLTIKQSKELTQIKKKGFYTINKVYQGMSTIG